jgi:GNAT superfamily N-acetyltransferase
VTSVRPLHADDRADWQRLYSGYAEFYENPLTDERADRVWHDLLDGAHESFGMLAVDDTGRPVGLAHCREFARPLAGSRGLYLDDLFTDPDARGTGTATALLEALRVLARERGLTVVRWITAGDNTRAQRVYDRVATKTPWLTYDLDPAATPATPDGAN